MLRMKWNVKQRERERERNKIFNFGCCRDVLLLYGLFILMLGNIALGNTVIAATAYLLIFFRVCAS